jgi:hypothetical protein
MRGAGIRAGLSRRVRSYRFDAFKRCNDFKGSFPRFGIDRRISFRLTH